MVHVEVWIIALYFTDLFVFLRVCSKIPEGFGIRTEPTRKQTGSQIYRLLFVSILARLPRDMEDSLQTGL